jgi:hypothetical protein
MSVVHSASQIIGKWKSFPQIVTQDLSKPTAIHNLVPSASARSRNRSTLERTPLRFAGGHRALKSYTSLDSLGKLKYFSAIYSNYHFSKQPCGTRTVST